MRRLMVALCEIPSVRVWRQNTGGVLVRDKRGAVERRFDAGPPPGAADITGICRGGRRLEVEVKGIYGKLTEQQVQWGRFITLMGGVYVVVRATADLDASVAWAVASVRTAIWGAQ